MISAKSSRVTIVCSVLSLVVSACDDDESDESNASEGVAEDTATMPETDSGSDRQQCLQSQGETTDGSTESVMEAWGSACTTNSECVERLGEGAECIQEAVIYELPGGYCTKPCSLEAGATFRLDDPTCSPDGGVACVGSNPIFQYCTVVCQDDAQCSREGYVCRRMPVLAEADDPRFCLMPDCCMETCGDS